TTCFCSGVLYADQVFNFTERNVTGSRYWYRIASSTDGMKLAAVVEGFIYTSTNGGVDWTERLGIPGAFWTTIASSDDGTNLVAGDLNSRIYTSTDSGATWTQQTSPFSGIWQSIASSSTGEKLAAVSIELAVGYIYTSLDFGVNWTRRDAAGQRDWVSIASSSDGTMLAAIVNGGYIYTSTNSGTSWTDRKNDAGRAWSSITSSADGTKLVAVVNGGSIYTSTNSGVDWSAKANPGISLIVSSSDGGRLNGAIYNGTSYTSTDFGDSWTQTNVTNREYYYLASSSDGTKLAAAVANDSIYTSTDFGQNWTKQIISGGRNWNSIASSSDATKLAATESSGRIFTSTNSGVNWIEQTNAISTNWMSIASSSDGYHLAAVARTVGHIFTSADSGATWTERLDDDVRDWNSITSSADGTRLAAIVNGGYIYVSDDSGVNWTEQLNSGQKNWFSISCSSDGTKLAAVVQAGYIYTSVNSGLTWTETNSGQRNWYSITSSSDGVRLAAVDNGGYIYTSNDSGFTWTEQTNAGQKYWRSITTSSDGTKLVAVVDAGKIYTGVEATPRVSTQPVATISTTSATAYGNITYLGQANPTVRGFCWSTSQNPTTALPTTSVDNVGPFNMGSFSASITDLTPGTLYYIRSYATNIAGITYGNEVTFTTASGSQFYTFTKQLDAGKKNWQSIASSWDGTKLAAVESDGFIYTSTDSGGTWTRTNSGNKAWRSITSSIDGTKLAAVVSGGGYIYTSTDSGVTWIEQTNSGQRDWYSIASSSDGTFLVAVVRGGSIYRSGDSGATWLELINAGSRLWYSIASSFDGSKIAAVTSGPDFIYTSANSGINWTPQADAGSREWSSITSSSDGTKLAAGVSGIGNDYIYTSTNSGANWTRQENSGTRAWIAIASSWDGTKLAAVAHGGSIFTSTNSGVGWTEEVNAGQLNWCPAIASSWDGTKLVTGVYDGYIYTSANSGTTWTQQTGSGTKMWDTIASSADGTKLVATGGVDYIYTSTDSGVTWIKQTNSGIKAWNAVASSSDGSKLAVGDVGGYIYTSPDSGATWTQQLNSGLNNWYSIASSSNGTKLAAVVYNGFIYTSADSGVNWTPRMNDQNRNWYSIVSSSDGNKLAAVFDSGYIYTSTNAGVDWTPRANAGIKNWFSIASSSDGTKLAAGANGDYIYFSSDSGATWTQRTNSGTGWWVSIGMSSDGSKIIATDGSYIKTSSDYGLTWTQQDNAGYKYWWESVAMSSDGTKIAVVSTGGHVNNIYNVGHIYTGIESTSGVTTQSVSGIGENSATANGNIVYIGDANPTVRGFCRSTSANPSLSDSCTSSNGNFGLGTFSASLSGLSSSTTYHVRAYLTNSAGTVYGNDVTFTTATPPPPPPQYSLTASAGTGGSISPSGMSWPYQGNSQTYTITPNSCYQIDQLTVDGASVTSASSYTFSNITSNHTISVTFNLIPYTIAATASTGGRIEPSGTVSVNCNESKTFTFTSDAFYQLADVKVDGTSVGKPSTYTIPNLKENHTIEVTFEKIKYTITATAGTGGTISPSGSVSVTHETNQTFTFTPDTGYEIADVSVDGKSVEKSSSYQFVSVTSAHTINVTFKLKTYAITVTSGTGGTVSPSGSAAVEHGTNKTFTFTPDANYVVSKLIVDGSALTQTVTPASYTFTQVTKPHTLQVEFTLKKYTITAAAQTGGKISPSGKIQVEHGSNQEFIITLDKGYHIKNIIVDEVPVKLTSQYTFTNVTKEHTITVEFGLRFIDNGDGTISDTKTGLMWQKADDSVNKTLDDAITYVNKLELANYTDWRLPIIDELLTLVDYSRNNPSISPVFECQSANYWSSTPLASANATAWSVSFGYGINNRRDPKTPQFFVRAVRLGPNWSIDPIDSLIPLDQNMVQDMRTGLIWQKQDDGIGKTSSDAKAYADALTLGGYDDWRLPEIDELLTIVDYNRLSPSITPLFECLSSNYWSGTEVETDPDGAWYVNFSTGYNNINLNSNLYSARAVRMSENWFFDPEKPLVVHAKAEETNGHVPFENKFQAWVIWGKPPYTYTWNFGDGTDPVVNERILSHVFTNDGNFSVQLTITDSNNITEVITLPITVTDYTTNTTDCLNTPHCFVAIQYQDFLGRDADMQGINFWANPLISNQITRADLVSMFLNSPEFQNIFGPITRLYFAYFNRIPDYDQLMSWINSYKAGKTLFEISEQFFLLPEFLNASNTQNNEAFLNALYWNVLGRLPDTDGKANWLSELNKGIKRSHVVFYFSRSEEYKAIIQNSIKVVLLYVAMLHRAPEDGGFRDWTTFLKNGGSELDLINGFLNSQEYQGRF
ncbi:MAG: DUF1566 domain-containing protein, partial [Desulfobacterales bacterium]|nr:DUF1566 domain-containing protein [Desulfobacterales bacterium]